MHEVAASLLEQQRAFDRWPGHSDLYTAKDHILHKLIEMLYIREQINYYWMMSDNTQVRQVLPQSIFDPTAKPFAPTESIKQD